MQSLIKKALKEAYKTGQKLGPEAGDIVEPGEGFGEVGKDIELRADKEIREAVLMVLASARIFGTVEIEGLGRKILDKDKMNLSAKFDPVDASLSFVRRQGTLGLPCSTVISVFEGVNPCFNDCQEAGLIDLRNGDIWLATKGKGCTLNGKTCQTSNLKRVDKSLGPIILGEVYYPSCRKLLAEAFSDFRGYFKDPGSAGYEMALVACGAVDAFISDQQKNDVLGAGYRMVKEGGGTVINFKGEDIGDSPYDFSAQTPMIMTGTRELAEEIKERIQKALKKLK